MNINCIIVDDEPLSRKFIERFCNKSGKVIVKNTFQNALDAIFYLRNSEVDLVFLDVEMPGINGFQMLDQLSYLPKVIMTTSKTDYAFTAFQYNVADFLKKPVDYNRFLDAVNKVQQSSTNIVSETTKTKNDIVIKSNGSYIRLTYDDILYIEGMGDYVKYVTSEKKYVAHNSLRAVEETMNKEKLIKVHRSYIVNVKKVKDFTANSLNIQGENIPVSKSNKALLLEKLRKVS